MSGFNVNGNGKIKNLAVLYLYFPHGRKYQKQVPIQELRKITSRFNCHTDIFYINNASEEEYVKKVSENEYEISGDNEFFEFSGWQRGVDFIRKNKRTYDAYLFVNDMFMHDSVFDRWLVNQNALRCATVYDAAVGSRKYFPVTGEILGNKVVPYLRTHIFLLSEAVLANLSSLVSVDAALRDRLFVPHYNASMLFQENAPLSAELRDFIFSYITSTWSRKRPYTEENFQMLRNKAVSILNSLLLSMRITQLGFPLISYTKTGLLVSRSFPVSHVNHLWSKSNVNGRLQKFLEPGEEYWDGNTPAYRRLAKKNPVHSYLRKILRKYFSPYHL